MFFRHFLAYKHDVVIDQTLVLEDTINVSAVMVSFLEGGVWVKDTETERRYQDWCESRRF
jgi:hypothetical protein